MLLDLWPLLVEEPTDPVSTGGGGGALGSPPHRDQKPDRRARARYGPGTITGRAVVTVRLTARTGTPQTVGRSTATLQIHATTSQAHIRGEHRAGLIIRASLSDDIEIPLLLLLAAAL